MSHKTPTSLSLSPVPALSGAARWPALAVLCLSLLSSRSTTVLNVALPTLVRDLQATTTVLQWIVDAYVLVSPAYYSSRAASRTGWAASGTFLAGLSLFAAGSAWAAFSGSVDMLIVARARWASGQR